MRITTGALLGAVAVFAALLPLSPAANAQDADAPAPSSVAPGLVIDDDFPDPDVFTENGAHWAYSTGSRHGRVPYATAAGPDGPWTIQGDAMPEPPAWTGGSGGL
ncbi:hypothetical protein [Streptomyces sp. MP131-18]|uniref:hypothetical protein n=1 Tax=Streptomyces sp. MP131-18 TaxID=1857892 RepID=UPI00097C6160|nr:hypothetical protein [Streptomyces sp. MP131-18]ONK15528.1 hypothetical protein STBA_63600 [Streptomyces sp. MP131-18]